MGRGQAGFSERYNLENKYSRQTVAVKDLFQKVEGLCSGETQIQTKSANTSILCCVFKQKPLFSLLSTLHHGSFGGRAPSTDWGFCIGATPGWIRGNTL